MAPVSSMFQIHIHGTDAERFAQELKVKFEELFETTEIQVHQASSSSSESSGSSEKIDPGLVISAAGLAVGAVSMILAIPSFLLAARELRARKDKAEKLQKALDYVQSRQALMNVQIVYIDARKQSQSLKDAEPADIMAAVEVDDDA